MDVIKDGVDDLKETIETELEQKRALKVNKISAVLRKPTATVVSDFIALEPDFIT